VSRLGWLLIESSIAAGVGLFDLSRAWGAQGICRPEDDHLFFAGGDGHQPGDSTKKAWAQAKEICAMCPVLDECRRDTLGEIHGVWGGLSPPERQRARRAFGKALMEGPEEERLAWAERIHALREEGAKWADVQQKTGVPVSVCELLWGVWDALLQERGAKGEVVDLPLPEPEGRRELKFPERPGDRHLWARHNGMITDAWYRGQTPDGEWLCIETWAGRGRSVKKWIRRRDAKVYRPQPVMILNYAGRPKDDQQHDLTA
jgi:WhiB family redox-sensing transcriptional regulator